MKKENITSKMELEDGQRQQSCPPDVCSVPTIFILRWLNVNKLQHRSPLTSCGSSLWNCQLQVVTLNFSLFSLAFAIVRSSLDKWVWGAPYATKWSVLHISMAIMSWGLRAGWCPAHSSAASKQLHYVSEPRRIVPDVFYCRAAVFYEYKATRLLGSTPGRWREWLGINPFTQLLKYANDNGERQTCTYFIEAWGRFDERIHWRVGAMATFWVKKGIQMLWFWTKSTCTWLYADTPISEQFAKSSLLLLLFVWNFYFPSFSISPPSFASIWAVCQTAWRINEHYYSTLGMKEERQRSKEIEVEQEGGVKSIIIQQIIV